MSKRQTPAAVIDEAESQPETPPAKKPRTRRTTRTSKIEFLAPLNPIAVAEPGTSNETLNQRKMREFHELEEAYYEIRRRYVQKYQELKRLILEGAQIQRGEWKPDYGVHLRRHPRYKQALIDAKGEDYQQRILNGTAPHAFFRVRIG